MPWLHHLEGIGLGAADAKVDRDLGFHDSSQVGAGEISMGGVSVILVRRIPP